MKLYNQQEAADLLGVSTQTLRDWERDGEGPTAIRIGKRSVRYREQDIESWLEEKASSQKEKKVSA